MPLRHDSCCTPHCCKLPTGTRPAFRPGPFAGPRVAAVPRVFSHVVWSTYRANVNAEGTLGWLSISFGSLNRYIIFDHHLIRSHKPLNDGPISRRHTRILMPERDTGAQSSVWVRPCSRCEPQKALMACFPVRVA